MSPVDEYAEKYGYDPTPIGFGERPAVLVVDFQKCFIDPKYQTGGRPLCVSALENTVTVLKAARAKGILVAQSVTVFHKDFSDKPFWKSPLSNCFEGEEAVELDERVADPSDVLIPKNVPSMFCGTRLDAMLVANCIDTVILTGIVSSGCIRATSIDSCAHGYRTIIPEECVGDFEEAPHRSNLLDIGRRYADIVPLAEVMAYIGSRAPAARSAA